MLFITLESGIILTLNNFMFSQLSFLNLKKNRKCFGFIMTCGLFLEL